MRAVLQAFLRAEHRWGEDDKLSERFIVERAAGKAATGRAVGRDADLQAIVAAPNSFGETALMLAASRGIPPTVVRVDVQIHGAPARCRAR